MPRQKKQHLKRRADGRYCCKYHGIQFMGNTEEEAFAAREEYKQVEKKETQPIPFLGEFAMRWIEIAHPNARKITYNFNVILLNKLVERFGHLPINEIKPSHIKTVFSESFAGVSDSYIKHARALYSGLFEAAREDGLCVLNRKA